MKDSIITSALFWYLVFGVVHEIGHILAALALIPTGKGQSLSLCFSKVRFWYELLLSRQVSLDLSSLFAVDDVTDATVETATVTKMAMTKIDFIHHAGWILSLLVALAVSCVGVRKSNNKQGYKYEQVNKSMQLAAWLTVLEALATDLFDISDWARLPPFTESSSFGTHTFWCGNFGILLLHHMWLQDRASRDSALDCLEQMIQITMMRGAQSGGVVTYQPCAGGGLKGTRRRVVNKKRTDLSQELRKRLVIPKNLPTNFCSFLQGHTRFATSSLSTLDGTHPHQWTPPTMRRIFNFNNNTFQDQMAENFITHNGDLDFYQLHGKTYEVETVLRWLAKVLELPAPASVDSMAIAGLVDMIRCRGCFALAARYSIAMAMTSATMDAGQTFPTISQLEKIGDVFQESWNKTVAAMSSDEKTNGAHGTPWSDSITFRTQLAMTAKEALDERSELWKPLKDCGHLSDNGEDSNSLYAFCVATVHAFLDNDLFYTTQIFLKSAKGSFGLTVSSSCDAHRQLVIAARGQTVSTEGVFPLYAFTKLLTTVNSF